MSLSLQIVEEIEEIGLKILNMELGSSETSVLNIKLPDDCFLDGWQYFSRRAKQKNIDVFVDEKIRTLHIEFKGIPWEAKGQDLLELFQKKFYLVNPKKDIFNVLIKPTHRCNLDCTYCYERENRKNIKEELKIEDIDHIAKMLSEYTERVQWIWHGGEATLMGIDWYKKAVKIFEKYPMLEVEMGLMSNGVLLTAEYATGLKELGIHYGISYDYINQMKSRSYNLKDDIVLKNIQEIAKVSDDKVGAINVVTKESSASLVDMYEWYKENNIAVSFNIIFGDSSEAFTEADLDTYEQSFLKFFSHWAYDEAGIYERTCMSVVQRLIGYREKNVCTFTECHKEWIGVNANGDIAPCDRMFPKEYMYGNIKQLTDIEDVFNSDGHSSMCAHIREREDKICKPCGYKELCGGLCNGTHIDAHKDARLVDEVSCELFKRELRVAYSILRNINMGDKINPHLNKLLIEYSFISIDEILKYIENEKLDMQLEYTYNDFINCSEFDVFYGFNSRLCKSKVNRQNYSYHANFFMAPIGMTREEMKLSNSECTQKQIKIVLEELQKELLSKMNKTQEISEGETLNE